MLCCLHVFSYVVCVCACVCFRCELILLEPFVVLSKWRSGLSNVLRILLT
jgi:hypothetical protein